MERDMQRIERGIKNTFAFYDEYTYPNLDSTYLQPNQVAEKNNRNFKFVLDLQMPIYTCVKYALHGLICSAKMMFNFTK